MRNLLQLIKKYQYFLLFLLFESLSFYLIVQYNTFQQGRMVNFTRSIAASVYEQSAEIRSYLSLREVNADLIEENASLRNTLLSSKIIRSSVFLEMADTLYEQKYRFTTANVINATVSKQNNLLTLNKGEKQGVEPEMGVISSQGVVGVVNAVSGSFSTVIPVINRSLRISARIKGSEYFGSVVWEGINYRYAELNEIPHHVDISIGDTIVTSGFSAIFPEGITVGYISEAEVRGGNFYNIEIRLANDFKSLHNVMVVKNILKEEQETLEEESMP